VIVVVDRARFDGDLESLPVDRNRVRVTEVNGGDFGYTARRRGMELATGSHLAFLDDDDAYTERAVEFFRRFAHGDRPVIFKMQHPSHGILWRTQQLEFGNVGTPMFLVPNKPSKLGEWEPHAPGLPEPGGDFTFISGCAEQMGEPIWRPEVVARVRPGRSVTVVTPWLNHEELLSDYAKAVEGADEVLVVDDGSDPPLDFAAIRSEETVGFSQACNAGLAEASCDVVLFLNNDVVSRRPDWMFRLVDAVEPGVLVGAKLRHDEHGDVDGARFPYLDGWCLAGMRDDLRALGGFDEDYMEPAYYSDNDLCLRARLAGMTLREVRVGIHHLVGATMPLDDPRKTLATEVNFERFAEKVRELVAS
jgi:GT2 family glycosyltransferase